MPRIRKCIICDKEFISYHGTNVCSEQCKIEKKKRQDENSNKRRYNKESNTPIIKICPICGKKFETLRRTYCSEECSKKAHKIYVKEISDQYYKDHREEIINKVKERKSNKY
jgi:predicted nucleic acid-binding Zn ribbon protein